MAAGSAEAQRNGRIPNRGFLELSPVTASSSSVSKTHTPQTPTRQTLTPQSPIPQSPTSAQDTPTSPGWKGRRGGSYVQSAMRRFESVESPESSPVKTNSSLFK
ncbi:mucin-17, partial [Tachysurus ichikawai]